MRAARAKARGYADFYAWPIDRDLEELGVVSALAASLQADDALFFSEARSRGRPHDPPDCEAVTLDGARIAIEVTELVDGAAIRAYKAGARYDWADWDSGKFLAGIAEAIAAKDARFPHLKGAPYEGGYIIIIHTDEPVLSLDLVSMFLSGHHFHKPAHLSRAFLLLSYAPAQERCPYVELRFEG